MKIKIKRPKLILKFPNPKQLKSTAFHSARTNLKSVKPTCSKDNKPQPRQLPTFSILRHSWPPQHRAYRTKQHEVSVGVEAEEIARGGGVKWEAEAEQAAGTRTGEPPATPHYSGRHCQRTTDMEGLAAPESMVASGMQIQHTQTKGHLCVDRSQCSEPSSLQSTEQKFVCCQTVKHTSTTQQF